MYALGDAATSAPLSTAAGAFPSPGAAPSTAQAAMQQADYAAWNIRAALRGEKLLPFRFQDLGEMLSLGDDAASLSALGLVEIKGPLASISRRVVYAWKHRWCGCCAWRTRTS